MWVAGSTLRNWIAADLAASSAAPAPAPASARRRPRLRPPALTKAELKKTIMRMIKKRTNLRPIRVARANCSKPNTSTYRCKLAFVAARRLFTGKLSVWKAANGKVHYSFKGRRYKINRAGGNYRAVRWNG